MLVKTNDTYVLIILSIYKYFNCIDESFDIEIDKWRGCFIFGLGKIGQSSELVITNILQTFESRML